MKTGCWKKAQPAARSVTGVILVGRVPPPDFDTPSTSSLGICQCSSPSDGFICWLQVKASPCRTSLGSFLQFPSALDWLSALHFPGLKVVKTTGLGESQQNSSAAVLAALEPRRGLRVLHWQKNLLVPWLCQLQAESGGQVQGTLNLLDDSGWLVHRWFYFKGWCFLRCLFFFYYFFFISSAEVSRAVQGWSLVFEVVWEGGDTKMGMGWFLVFIAWE